MRKNILILIAIAVTLSLSAQSVRDFYVSSNMLNLRAAPDTKAEIITKLNQYDNIILLEDSIPNGWAKIQVGTNEGFVFKKYIKKGKAHVTTYQVRVGAVCRDGTRSSATGRGACSHHKGVSYWLKESKKTVRIENEP